MDRRLYDVGTYVALNATFVTQIRANKHAESRHTVETLYMTVNVTIAVYILGNYLLLF